MYTILETTTIFSWKIFDIVEERIAIGWGKEKTFEKAVRSPWTRLIIIDDSNTKILLTREYRKEIGWYDYRLPGGKVADTMIAYKDILKKPEWIEYYASQAAMREAKEEVWIESGDINLLTVSHAWATVERDLYYFVLRNCTFWEQELESGEYITYKFYSLEEIISLCLSWEVKEDRSCSIVLQFLHKEYGLVCTMST